MFSSRCMVCLGSALCERVLLLFLVIVDGLAFARCSS
jgi:hypothetical protein